MDQWVWWTWPMVSALIVLFVYKSIPGTKRQRVQLTEEALWKREITETVARLWLEARVKTQYQLPGSLQHLDHEIFTLAKLQEATASRTMWMALEQMKQRKVAERKSLSFTKFGSENPTQALERSQQQIPMAYMYLDPFSKQSSGPDQQG